MLRMILMMLFFAVSTAPLTQAQDANIAAIKIRVEGVRNIPGEVGVAIFSSKLGYPTHLEHAYETEWVPLKKKQDTVEVEFDAVPPGEYAISVVHDVNDNRLVDRSRLGFPKEGVGFSNDVKIILSNPKFKKAKLNLKGGKTQKIVIQLVYRD